MNRITCPMCGTSFDPEEHVACQSCPLQRGCQLVCCPVCGYESVDPRQSTLVRFATALLKRKSHNNPASESRS